MTAPSLARTLVLLTAVISGVSVFVNYYAIQGTNSDAFLTVRNATVAIFLLALIPLGRRLTLPRRDWGRLLLVGLIGGAIPFLLFFRGLQLAGQAGAASASFGYRTLFLMAAVIGVVALGERLSLRYAAAAGLILAGNVLLLSLTAPVWSDGTALVLLATGLWAGEYALSKRLLRDLDGWTVALGRMGFGAVFLLGFLLATGQIGGLGALTAAHWGWVLISALLLTAFVATWYGGLKEVDLSRASLVLALAFPITWVLSVAVGRTPLGLPQAAGAAAVAFGVALGVGLTTLRGMWDAVLQRLRATAGARG